MTTMAAICKGASGLLSAEKAKTKKYKDRDGRWLNGLRHTDRGNLMTDVAIDAKPWVSAAGDQP